jgi:hypothetical protein
MYSCDCPQAIGAVLTSYAPCRASSCARRWAATLSHGRGTSSMEEFSCSACGTVLRPTGAWCPPIGVPRGTAACALADPNNHNGETPHAHASSRARKWTSRRSNRRTSFVAKCPTRYPATLTALPATGQSGSCPDGTEFLATVADMVQLAWLSIGSGTGGRNDLPRPEKHWGGNDMG